MPLNIALPRHPLPARKITEIVLMRPSLTLKGDIKIRTVSVPVGENPRQPVSEIKIPEADVVQLLTLEHMDLLVDKEGEVLSVPALDEDYGANRNGGYREEPAYQARDYAVTDN